MSQLINKFGKVAEHTISTPNLILLLYSGRDDSKMKLRMKSIYNTTKKSKNTLE